LAADKNESVAFRKPDAPKQELLFSSAANRIRFENIILQKGVALLQEAQNLKPNHRPLGATFPSYKTMGTGTLFLPGEIFQILVRLYFGGKWAGNHCFGCIKEVWQSNTVLLYS